MERRLADSLLLLAEQQVGDRKLWLLPQSEWREGETLRQTAQRALTSLSGNTNSFPCVVRMSQRRAHD